MRSALPGERANRAGVGVSLNFDDKTPSMMSFCSEFCGQKVKHECADVKCAAQTDPASTDRLGELTTSSSSLLLSFRPSIHVGSYPTTHIHPFQSLILR